MHTVDIGIGRNNYFVVSQSIQSVFNIEGRLQEIELFIFINDLLRQAITVKRLTT